MTDMRSIALRGAGLALLYLIGPFAISTGIGVSLSILAEQNLKIGSFSLSSYLMHNLETIGFSIIAALCVAGSVGWSRALARLSGLPDSRRLMWAGALSFRPGVIGAALGLGSLATLAEEGGLPLGGVQLPIHILFMILFTTATFAVGALIGLAVGIALKNWGMAGRLFLFSGLAGGLGFLTPTLILDLLGRRVGGPRAAETATMITTMLLGQIVATAVGGAVIAVLVARFAARKEGSPEGSPVPANELAA